MLRCVRDTDMQLGRLAPTRIIPEVMIIMILVRELARGLESPNLLFMSRVLGVVWQCRSLIAPDKGGRTHSKELRAR